MLFTNAVLTFLSVGAVISSALPNAAPDSSASNTVNKTNCNNQDYVYQSLAGYGFVPSNARDKYGDTLGGYGSAAAIDRQSWKKTSKGSYKGIIYTLPDRGWNTEGTLNYQNRIHKFAFTLTLADSATAEHPSAPNLQFTYQDTILLTGPDGTPTTGLDADVTGSITYPGFPQLPVATYKGNGFGGAGPGGKRITIDSEGLVLASDGGFFVSDEYGPYIYKFSRSGKMELAIQPPPAYLPHRNNTLSFSADSPPIYNLNETITPADTTTGRDNNQGLEGLTVSRSGKKLFALMQSALDQEGGPNDPSRLQARLLEYDISNPSKPNYKHEYVVTLPLYVPAGKTKQKVAAQSEIHALGEHQFLVLARDSNAGHGASGSQSVYRHADIFDISHATDISKPKSNDDTTGAIANADGVLNKGITAAEYCTFLDFNVNSQLAKFGLHNGGAQDSNLLNEKWESLTLVPVDGDQGKDGDWFLFSLSDNDFITQDGFMNFGKFPYKDASGFNVDNQALVFQVSVPGDAKVS